MAPAIDVEQLALYLPVETAAQAVKDLRDQGLKGEAKQLEAAVQKKMDDLAKAKAEADAKAEAGRQQTLADARDKFASAVADFVALRDEALDHLAAYLEVAEKAIAESGNYHALYTAMHSLLKPEDYEGRANGSIKDPLPELPESAVQIVNKDPRFKGKFASSNHGLGGSVNL
jgi:hypothetical protein